MTEQEILTFKILKLSSDKFRLVVWEDDRVKDIYENSSRKIRTSARKMLDEALELQK